MPTVVVLYPRQADASFDFDYYTSTHLPLVSSRWTEAGLSSVAALRGTAGPDGGDGPYLAIALLTFGSQAGLDAALGGPHTAEIMGDIANFTNVQPILQMTTSL